MKKQNKSKGDSQSVLNAYRKLKSLDQSSMTYIERNRLNETISDIRNRLLSLGYNVKGY